MSLMGDDDFTGLARTLGQLRLQAAERTVATGMELVDAGELATSRANELRALAQLDAAKRQVESLTATVHSLRMVAKAAREISAPARKAMVSSAELELREEIVALEARLRAAQQESAAQKQRIARLEAASKAVMDASGDISQTREQAVEYKRHIERLEAEGRRYAMQIAELQRGTSNKDAYIGALTREIDHLKSQPAKVVEAPAQSAECPTCAPIIQAVAMAVRAQTPVITPTPTLVHRMSDITRPDKHHPNHLSPQAERGIADRIRDALAQTQTPMFTRDISAAIGIDAKKVATNIPHLISKGDVVVVGEPCRRRGRRYWLKARPLPQGASA